MSAASLVVSPSAIGNPPPPGSIETMPHDLDTIQFSNNGAPSPQRLSFEKYGIDGIKTPKRHNSSRFEISEKRELEPLPSLAEVDSHEITDLFYAKSINVL